MVEITRPFAKIGHSGSHSCKNGHQQLLPHSLFRHYFCSLLFFPCAFNVRACVYVCVCAENACGKDHFATLVMLTSWIERKVVSLLSKWNFSFRPIASHSIFAYFVRKKGNIFLFRVNFDYTRLWLDLINSQINGKQVKQIALSM